MEPALHEVTFDKLTYGGSALGRLADGRAIFVPFALPGERARVRVVQQKAGYARGQLIEMLEPSPDRIKARCKHFGLCGGCHYQQLSYEKQVEAKAEILRDQLGRIAKIENAPVQPTVAAPNPWNYRNQIQFRLTREGRLGYIVAEGRAGPADDVFAVEECHLPIPSIDELWRQIGFETLPAIARVTLRAGADDELMMVLEGTSETAPEVEIEGSLSVVHTFEGDCFALAGRDFLKMRLGGRDFQVTATSFFQVNTAVAEKMVEHVLSLVPDTTETIIDVYCGVGLFSAFLALRCRRLIGIEESAAACKDFEINLDEFDNVELYEASAEEVLPSLETRADIVVLDPPRAGLGAQVLEALARSKPTKIIYVSCDPSTLARDLKRLIEEGFRLVQVTPFDMFPQTYHIESISVLERAG